MKVYELVKIRHHPQPDGPGCQYGDVVLFLRADHKFSDKELKYFLPVPMDINVPCGDKYDKEMRGKCGECKDNDPALCDVQKYCRGEWTEGSVFEAPTLTHKFQFKVDLGAVCGEAVLTKAEKEEQTAEDKTSITTWAAETSTKESALVDKISLIKEKV